MQVFGLVPHTASADVLQKFKVRIEDPPRRRHMVFLGGAVLANIVCLPRCFRGRVALILTLSFADGGQGKNVGVKTRMGRAGTAGTRKAWT